MMLSKTVSILWLGLFTVSCLPIPLSPSESPAMAPPVERDPVQPVSWPGFHEGWMHFKGSSYIGSTVYDPDGYLWAAGRSSVYRWDFLTGGFTEYAASDGLPDNITSMAAYGGRMWVSSGEGMVSYYSDGSWVTQSVASKALYHFSITGDRLWVSGEDLYFNDGSEWQQYDSMPAEYKDTYRYYRVAESRDGSLWFWTYDHVLRLDGSRWQEYRNLQGMNNVVAQSDGTLLFIFSNLIIAFDGSAFTPLVLPGERFTYSVTSALPAADGDLWLQIYDPHSNPQTGGYPTYTIHAGQANPGSPVIFKDFPEGMNTSPIAMTPDGWIFSSSQGLFHYDGNRWKRFEVEVHSPISKVMTNGVIGFDSDGTLWTYRSGLPVRFDGRDILSDPEEVLCSNYPWKWLIDPRGILWGGSPDTNSLCRYDPVRRQASIVELFFNIADFALSSDGSVWVASTGGYLAKLTPEYLGSGDYHDLELIKIGEGLVRRSIEPARIMAGSDGAVWIFAVNVGLYRYDGSGWKYIGLHKLHDPTALAIDSQGRVWAGLPGKLLKFEGEQWTSYPFNCLCPTKLITDRDDAVWFVHGCDGVYRFDEVEWTHYSQKDIGGFVPDRILVAPDGALWFFGYQNWSRFQP